MAYFVHYAGSTFPLVNAEGAFTLMHEIDTIAKRGAGGRLKIHLDGGGIAFIYVSPHTQVAISGFSEAEANNI